MGNLFSKNKEQKKKSENVTKSKAQQSIQNVDVVKSKLKISRDKVNNIIKAKNLDIDKVDEKIKEQLPTYQQTGNKKKIIPLLKAKKDLQTFVENAQVRVKLLNQKLSQVEMQQVNADTINALEDSNKYIKQMQDMMEKKDWQGVIEDAKQKYQLEWPQEDEEIQEDPAFQAMWQQLGGNKIDKKINDKKPAEKTVKVQVPEKQKQVNKKQANIQMA